MKNASLPSTYSRIQAVHTDQTGGSGGRPPPSWKFSFHSPILPSLSPSQPTGNGAKWELAIKLAYAAVSALIVANLVTEFLPASFSPGLGLGSGSPTLLPQLSRWGELCVLAAAPLMGSRNFGPQAGKQVSSGLSKLKI